MGRRHRGGVRGNGAATVRERLQLLTAHTNCASVLRGALLESAPVCDHSLTVVAPLHGRFSVRANDIIQNWSL